MVTFPKRKTKTWKGRHSDKISNLVSILEQLRMRDPIVLQVGAGGIVAEYVSLFPEGAEETMSFLDKKKLQIASIRESRARARPGAIFANFETPELYHRLEETVGLERMYVVENDPGVMDAVARHNLPKVVLINHDISLGFPMYGGEKLQADVGVIYKTLEYQGKYNASLAHFLGCIRNQGIIGATFPKRKEPFPQSLRLMKKHVYLNGARPDMKKGWGRVGPPLDEAEIIQAAEEVDARGNENG